VPEFIGTELYREPIYILGTLFFFLSTAFVVAYLAVTLNRQLRSRTAQVVELSEHLQKAYGRLQILYDGAQAVNSTLELQQVLDRVVRGTAEAMGVRACSIRLLDESGARLRVASVYGLSDAYVQKGDLLIDRNPLAREVLVGKTIITNDVTGETGLQYPAEALAEGIGSMLSAPLHGKKKMLGLIRAYSVERNRFTPDDAEFLAAIASQGSIAIENALAYQELSKLDETKSKFALTVTHELRSPVSVVRSLLRTMTGDYAGALSAGQRDLAARALRRADFLQTLIDDLLDLAAGKSEMGAREERVLVQLGDALERVIQRFEASARERQITLE
jgi:signal transduction histidine kinase